jgi:hypothetical protein
VIEQVIPAFEKVFPATAGTHNPWVAGCQRAEGFAKTDGEVSGVEQRDEA